MRAALEILVPAWVIISIPVAVLIGRHFARRGVGTEAPDGDLAEPFGGAECGCFWHYLPEGHIRIWTCDSHAFICTPEGGTCAHCPDCGAELQDEAFEFWCPDCEAAVSYARAAEGA